MGGSEDDSACAVDGVDARGENLDGLDAGNIGYRESDTCANGFADPIALHGDDAIGPSAFKFFQIFKELIGVMSGLEEPLLDFAGLDEGVFVAPAVAAVDDLLVGQHGAALGTPVDATLFAIGEAALEHAQKKPLIPTIVLRIAGGDFAAPVVAETEATENALKFVNVVASPGERMSVVLDGGVFCGQAESVPTHRVQDVEAAHALYASHHVADSVIAHVAHVHGAGGVGQHLEGVIFWFCGIYLSLEDARLGPAVLPFGFDFLWVVFGHAIDFLCYCRAIERARFGKRALQNLTIFWPPS